MTETPAKKGVHLSKVFRTSKGTPCDTYEQAVKQEREEKREAFADMVVQAKGRRDLAESLYDNVVAYLILLKAAGLVVDYTLPEKKV